MLAPNTNNYFYGSGRLYFKSNNDAGFLALGNVPKLEIEITIEKQTHYSNQEGTRLKDKERIAEKGATASFDMEEYSAENLNLAFLGNGIQSGSQLSGQLDSEQITPIDDRFVSLGKMELSILKIDHGAVTDGPFEPGETITGTTSSATAKIAWADNTNRYLECIDLTGTFQEGETITGGTSTATASVTSISTKKDVVVTDAAIPTKRYVLGIDYSLDLTGGLIRKLKTGSITTTCFVSANYAAKTTKSIRALANSEVTGELLFIPTSDDGPRWKIEGWKVSLSINGAVGFITEDVGSIPMSAEFLADTENHPDEPFYRATEII
ncbi:MAG: hypothetical protein KJ737_23105 [Proteobacteria bacterium]|nr:hypothetical protein [Pseudomonadota bacterium]